MEKLLYILLILPIIYEALMLCILKSQYQRMYNHIMNMSTDIKIHECLYNRVHIEFNKFQLFYLLLCIFGLCTNQWLFFVSIFILSFLKGYAYKSLPFNMMFVVHKIDSLITLIILIKCTVTYWCS